MESKARHKSFAFVLGEIMDFLNDTIAAISSPRGTGGVAVIRISGEGSFAVCDKLLTTYKKRPLHELTPSKLYRCVINGENGSIDDCMCAYFKGPSSFTGEDTVEIYCHGGALCTSLVLERCFVCGARQALAGEFTKRAFVNGKLSLTAAEAVGELIHAKTKAAVAISNSNMHSTLDRKISEISDAIKEILASVYVYIDYPDEELYDLSASEMAEKLSLIKEDISTLSKSYRSGMAVSSGISTAIVGTPNVGKSTLLNLLCKKERAIVTDIAGTTRDIISEEVVLGDILLKLSDTAGVRKTDDVVESIGVNLSLSQIDEAELIFAVFDGTRELSSDDRELINKLKDSSKTVLAIVNKTDEGEMPLKEISESFDNVISISAKNADSARLIEDTVRKLFLDESLDFGTSPIVTSAERNAALTSAKESIDRAISLLLASGEQTIAGSLCEEAVSALDSSSGKAVSEDVVNTIFSRFCVGK